MREHCKEKNIRYFLKDIYELYSNVSDLIFTTFNFEPDFFEEHVITFLMGSDKKISTIGELNATNEWINVHGVSVYYDKGALIPGNSCITLPVYPQHVKTGVFHPKVTVVHGILKKNGRPATHLIVGSCNLTVSGYGRNREAFSYVQVTSEQVAKSLLQFIDTLSGDDDSRHKTVREHLKRSEFTRNKNVEFFWNYGKKGKGLLSRLSTMPKGDMTIISPYFDEYGPEALLKRIANKEHVTIVPAVDGENYNIYYKNYESLKSEGIDFVMLTGDGVNKRFIHAKIIIKGKYAIIGSNNFTTASLDQLNAEAALIFNKDGIVEFSTINVEDNRFLSEQESIENRDELNQKLEKVFVSVTIDWKLDHIIIHANISDESSCYYVKIDGMKESPEWSLKDCGENIDMKISLTDTLICGLLRHKQFSVYKNNEICFKGLINEINWVGVRPEIGCASLDETLAEWYMVSNGKTKNSAFELRCITQEDTETEKIIGSDLEFSADIFDNYYMLSKALEYLIQQVQINLEGISEVCTAQRDCPRRREWKKRVDNARNSLYGILFSWPGSISQMLKFLEKNEQEENFDVVYGWLICRYLKLALKMIPKKIDELPIMQKKYKVVKKKLKQVNDRLLVKIKEECSPAFLDWIDRELFRKEI